MVSILHLTLSLRHCESSNVVITSRLHYFYCNTHLRENLARKNIPTYLLLRGNFTSISFFAVERTLRIKSLEPLTRNLNTEIILIDIASSYTIRT